VAQKLDATNPLSRVVHDPIELGAVLRERRKSMKLRQLDVAGLGNTGNRVIVEIENGKPTAQLQKVLDLVELLGLELVIQEKRSRAL